MSSGANEIRLLELKDTISQLNTTISTQNELIHSMQKMLQERDAKDSEKDKLIANLQVQLDYLKTKLFGSTSEIRHDQMPGQMNLFVVRQINRCFSLQIKTDILMLNAA